MEAKAANLSEVERRASNLRYLILNAPIEKLEQLAQLESNNAWSTSEWTTAVSKALDYAIIGELKQGYPKTLTILREICNERKPKKDLQSLYGSMTDLCLGVLTQDHIKKEYTDLLLKPARTVGLKV